MPSVTAPDYALACTVGNSIPGAVHPVFDTADPVESRITVQTSNPAHGTLSPVFPVVPGVTWTYTPEADFVGVDSFDYEALALDSGLSDTGTITITVTAVPDFPLVGVHKVLLPSAELQFCDAIGRPYAGGTLDTYVIGTTTPKTTWMDSAGDVENENPIRLDASGRCIIYGNGGYRTVLKDADGNLVWDQPSYTYVSVAMLPVVGAATLADAREAMGINDAIDAEALARAAADSAEAIARADADAAEATARAAADAAEAAARAAGDAALQAEIDALPPAIVSNVQGSWGQVDASGHVRITFPSAFASLLSVVVSYKGVGFGSNTLVVGNEDIYGFDIWITQAGTPIPKPNELFYWLALGT